MTLPRAAATSKKPLPCIAAQPKPCKTSGSNEGGESHEEVHLAQSPACPRCRRIVRCESTLRLRLPRIVLPVCLRRPPFRRAPSLLALETHAALTPALLHVPCAPRPRFRNRGHERRTGWQRPSERRRPRCRSSRFRLDRDLLGDADRAEGLPHRRSLHRRIDRSGLRDVRDDARPFQLDLATRHTGDGSWLRPRPFRSA